MTPQEYEYLCNILKERSGLLLAADKQYLIDAGNTGGSFGIPTFVAGDPRRVGVQASLRW